MWHTFFDKLRLIFAGSRRNISKPFPIHNLLQVDLSQNIHLVNDRCHVRRFLGMNLVHCTWPVLRLHWPSRSIYFRWRNVKSKWSRYFYKRQLERGEINIIQMNNPRSCEGNLCNCVRTRKKEKKRFSGLQRDLSPWRRDIGATL